MGKKADEYIASRVNSVIGRGTEFEGTIRTKETIRVEGFVKGNIISEGTVIVGNGGNVDGKIEAANILIGGEVHGELYASEKIEANSSGRIYGNLHTKGLIVDEKALFQGTCEMTGREESKASSEQEKVPEEPKQETA
ncbi:MAG: polymer-forming cytoskeletal protein [Lachnospiraceae bacterium]|nr:polymer-forming cytoskeletal protein [Lachnospiraceae bacterium]